MFLAVLGMITLAVVYVSCLLFSFVSKTNCCSGTNIPARKAPLQIMSTQEIIKVANIRVSSVCWRLV